MLQIRPSIWPTSWRICAWKYRQLTPLVYKWSRQGWLLFYSKAYSRLFKSGRYGGVPIIYNRSKWVIFTACAQAVFRKTYPVKIISEKRGKNRQKARKNRPICEFIIHFNVSGRTPRKIQKMSRRFLSQKATFHRLYTIGSYKGRHQLLDAPIFNGQIWYNLTKISFTGISKIDSNRQNSKEIGWLYFL